MEKLGFSEADVRQVNPGILYCAITGYGFAGPMAAERAYDPIMQARSGFASMQGNDEFGRPMMVRTIIDDHHR